MAPGGAMKRTAAAAGLVLASTGKGGRGSANAAVARSVDARRVRKLAGGDVVAGGGPVVYWCSRENRVCDNWALLHASEESRSRGVGLAVVVALPPSLWREGQRHSGFRLRGLMEVERKLREKDIPMFVLDGEPSKTIPSLLKACDAGLLVCDFSPLREARRWREDVAKAVDIPVHEVDAHNVVPLWVTSAKQEYAARTIRPKINRVLHEWTKEIPELPLPAAGCAWETGKMEPEEVPWDAYLERARAEGPDVPEVGWCQPGEEAGMAALHAFLAAKRLALYDTKRNDPATPLAVSNLSPWINFGHLSAQRAVLEAKKHRRAHPKAVDGFQEELVIRRELSDNFCYYNSNYDSIEGASAWAQETLRIHSADVREHTYSQEILERAKTHDELWNAAQLELVHVGKMHGFMRMYWAKKILEWTSSPSEALRLALLFNDRYSLDGRDPNGFVGCMWSICGIHDQGWTERKVFGKIRYMNYAGCKRKFKIQDYVGRINKKVFDLKRSPAKKDTVVS